MKKIISCLLLVTVLCLGLSLTAYANDRDFTVSEDYKTIILDGITYIRTNTSSMIVYETRELGRQPTLSTSQKSELLDTVFRADTQKDLLEGTFFFIDGTILSASYLREGYLEEFIHWTTGDDVEYEIDFYWPSGNTVPVTVDQLKGEPVTLGDTTLYWSETYEVTLPIENESRYVQRGVVLIENDQYYYLDYPENPQLIINGYYDPSMYSSIDAYEITDPQLLASLKQAKKDSEQGTQILSSSSFGNTLSAIMMTLLFGVLPLGMLILTGILAIRSKGSYRVIWGATAGFACTTLLIYIGFVIQLFIR